MITLETALTSARQALTTVAERADRQGYYTGARTDIINSHAELRAALDLLIKAAAPRHRTPALAPATGPPAVQKRQKMPPAGTSGSGMEAKAPRRAGRRSRLGWKHGHPAAGIPGQAEQTRPGRSRSVRR